MFGFIALWVTLILGILATVYGGNHLEKSDPRKKPGTLEFRFGNEVRKVSVEPEVFNWGGCLVLILGLILLGLFCWLEWGSFT